MSFLPFRRTEHRLGPDSKNFFWEYTEPAEPLFRSSKGKPYTFIWTFLHVINTFRLIYWNIIHDGKGQIIGQWLYGESCVMELLRSVQVRSITHINAPTLFYFTLQCWRNRHQRVENL
jgi:hypothetical protein